METIAQTAWLVLTDPNISFLLLVVAVWSIAMAVSVPGTGLPEAAAVVCLALALVGLVQLPVSVVGLALIGVALALFIAEFQIQSHGALLLGGAVALGVGALLLFPADGRSHARLSWVTAISAPVLSTLFFGALVRKGLAAQRAPALQDLRRLVGTTGVTRTPVGREGTVYVAGEEWSATADRPIPPGTDIVVVARRGLVLRVAPAPRARPEPQPAPPANPHP